MRLNEIDIKRYADQIPNEIASIISEYRSVIERYIEHDVKIYRGIRRSSPNLFVSDGSTMFRRAANTTNFTNILTSVLPSWQGWPVRPKSFICSLNRSYASTYGNLYIAIPLENQPVAVSSKEDFWFSLPNGLGQIDVSELNGVLEILFGYFDKDHDVEDIEDNVDLILSATDKILKNANDETIEAAVKPLDSGYFQMISKQVVTKLQEIGSSEKFYDTVLDPKPNNQLYKTFDIIPLGKGEVWMSGKVLFIESTMWNNFLNKFFGDNE